MKQKQQKKKKKSHIPVRMNILFFSVFVLFSILILRLGVIQIVQGEEYRMEVERKDEISVDFSVPRGEIFDRYYNKIVTNIPQKAITYTPPTIPRPSELYEISAKLGQLIVMSEDEIEDVTERDKKDIWILLNENGNEKITDKELEQLKAGTLKDDEIYQLKLERITEEDLAELDLNVAAIYRKLSRAVALTPTIIKNKDVSDKEFALVSENLADLPGVDVTTDWAREKVYDTTMASVIGQWSEGLQAEDKDYYLAKGYSLNDRIGSSYLERAYEDVLQGTKSKVKTVTDKNGNVIETEVISDGQSGKDLVLTIDMELQAEIEKIVQEEITTMKTYPYTETLDRAFVVAMDPKTGEVLSLVGKQWDKATNTFKEYSHGNFTQAFEMGSAVKGAIVLTGYETGVLTPGEYKVDEPLDLKSTKLKQSWNGRMGRINDLKALEWSSNVYMWKIVIDIMEGKYVPGGALPLNKEKINDIRYYLSQFGLGIQTGIGFDEEIEGLKANPDNNGTLIDIAIGQLDTYTPLQLAQYVSTIANDGYRMKPTIVKEIREQDIDGDGVGTLVDQTTPTVLNRIDMEPEWIERVQEGFWLVAHGRNGTARSYFVNEPYNMAAKTGTAQSFHWDSEKQKLTATYNLTFVGYAPYEDPEIAISVVVPWAYHTDTKYSVNNYIAKRVMSKYFELKEQRQFGENVDNPVNDNDINDTDETTNNDNQDDTNNE